VIAIYGAIAPDITIRVIVSSSRRRAPYRHKTAASDVIQLSVTRGLARQGRPDRRRRQRLRHPADGDVIAHSEPGTGGEYELALPEPSTADAELIGQQGSARL
jgi:hypothetical protein